MPIYLLYYSIISRENILSALSELVPELQVKLFTSLFDFLGYISKPLVSSQNIALLYVDTPEDLAQLVQRRTLLQDMDFLLILTKVSGEMSHDASLLSPRLTFFDEPDLETICNVIKKLHLSRMQKKAAWARRLP